MVATLAPVWGKAMKKQINIVQRLPAKGQICKNEMKKIEISKL
jgi:hypothetical protein